VQGHDVCVLATDHREANPGAIADDPGVHRELRWWWRDGEWPRRGLRERLALERHNHVVLAHHLADHRPDVIAWWAMGGMTLSLVEHARRAGIPAVGLVHDDWLIYGPREDQWLRLFRGRRRHLAPLAERATGVPARLDAGAAATWLFVSETTRRRALDHGTQPLPRTAVAHSGIDHRWIGDERAAPPWRWRLLHVGRLDPRKGVEVAADALTHLPEEARLVLAGPGDATALPNASRIDALGLRPRDELPDIYAAADAVLFPVLWDEPWGLVPLEAMALGRPVIATGRGGSAEYLRNEENCLLVPPGAPPALAAAVRRLAEDQPLRERLRAGGLATAREHTDTRFNARVEEALRAAAVESSRRR
jgi:glycosyltransferase involved in cell wall biosynthesis